LSDEINDKKALKREGKKNKQTWSNLLNLFRFATHEILDPDSIEKLNSQPI
jgi:hypothetical protein